MQSEGVNPYNQSAVGVIALVAVVVALVADVERDVGVIPIDLPSREERMRIQIHLHIYIPNLRGPVGSLKAIF